MRYYFFIIIALALLSGQPTAAAQDLAGSLDLIYLTLAAQNNGAATDAQDLTVVGSRPAEGDSAVALNTTISFDFTLPLDTSARYYDDLPVEFFAISPRDSIQIDSVHYSADLTTLHLDVRHTDNTDFVWIVTGARSPSDTLFCKPFVLNYSTARTRGPWKVSGEANPIVTVKQARCYLTTVVVALYSDPIERQSGSLSRGLTHPAESETYGYPLAATVTDESAQFLFNVNGVRNGVYWPVAIGVDGWNRWFWTEPFDADGDQTADSVVVDDENLGGIRFWAFAGAREPDENRGRNVRMSGAYPDPAHSQTTVEVDLDEPTAITLGVFDLLGRMVLSIPERFYYRGRLAIALDVSALPAGVYLVQLKAEDRVETRGVVVAR